MNEIAYQMKPHKNWNEWMKEQNQLKIDIKTDIDRSERINLLCSCGET